MSANNTPKSSIGRIFETSFTCASEQDAKRAKFLIINAMRGNINIEDVRRVRVGEDTHIILVTSKQTKEIEKPNSGKPKDES